MAGVLDALASYVTDMLTKMASKEVAMLIGVSREIDNLGVKLRDLKNFLADADRRNITDKSVQGWVEELKRAMYHATDILDLCQLKVMEQGPSKDMGCLNPLLFCMRNPLHAHDIGSRIKILYHKLDDISKRAGSFNFINLNTYREPMTQHPTTDRTTYPLLERSSVVGEKIEDDTRTVVEMLTNEVDINKSDSITVVAIVGVGGIGKTTLGKKVFNDELMQAKFAKKIWLCITQDFNEIELLRKAIIAVSGELPGHGAGDKGLLVQALADAIKDKKIFLVLDDMWATSVWNNLLKIPFSHCTPSSRVLITTRHDTVARGMKAMYPYHHVDKLGTEDAWSLLKKQVLANEKNESEIDMLKDIGLQIIAKCDGLPLAIKVMGGLLCQRKKEKRDWERVLIDARWSVSQMPEDLNYAIYLSYNDLPPCLKQCFLHFSLKPKNITLTIAQVVSMWISEGFVHGNSDGLEELGSEYCKDLILRNLIEPDTQYLGQYVGNMHDLVRSFAQFVARDEALIAHNGEIDNSKLISQRFLRLSIETKGLESDGFEWRSLQKQKSLRTLIFSGNFKIQSSDSLVAFSSLRALHIESTNIDTLVKSLHQLKHLRYLALRCNDMPTLPENIQEMKFLQHISLEVCESIVELPDNIVKLRELRHLDLGATRVSSMPKDFHVLKNLRVLYGFKAHMAGDWCSLEELGTLSQLTSLGLYGLENVSDTSFAAKAELGAKLHLTMMKLNCNRRFFSRAEEQRIEEVFDELCPGPSLEELHINGYFGRRLPRWMMSIANAPLGSLKMLTLKGLILCTQLPDGLCRLPCLEFLEVCDAPAVKHVGATFLQPNNHHHHPPSQAAAAFPRLLNMILSRMVEWDEWVWAEEAEAMTILEQLTFTMCNLKCIPPGLALHAKALKKLTLWSIWRLHSLENFPFVVDLDLYDLPKLTSISNFPKLLKLEIKSCPELSSLEEMTALRRLVLTVPGYGQRFDQLPLSKRGLPLYLQTVKPSHLQVDCGLEILSFMAAGKSGCEWDKFSHIQHVEAYADSEYKWDDKKWHLLYTREPFSMETNVQISQATLPDVGRARIVSRHRRARWWEDYFDAERTKSEE